MDARSAVLIALGSVSGCASVNSYATPQVLPSGHSEVGFATPVAYSVSNRRQLPPAPRPLRDEDAAGSAVPGVAFARVGVLDVADLGVQLENGLLVPYAKAQLWRGRTNLAVRAGGAPKVGSPGYGASGRALASVRLGALEPVVGAGVAWWVHPSPRDELTPAPTFPEGRLGRLAFVSLGLRAAIGGVVVHPEVSSFRAFSGDSVGWTAGLAWIFAGRLPAARREPAR